MFRETAHMLHGAFLWAVLRLKLGIDDRKAVLVLADDSRKLDYYALVHLRDYMDRKYADGAVVLFHDKKTRRLARKVLGKYKNRAENVHLRQCSKKNIETIYDYYSFHKFFDNIAFTYVSRPADNLLGRALKETRIDEEDAVCLGLYHLRTVPAHDPRKKDERI